MCELESSKTPCPGNNKTAPAVINPSISSNSRNRIQLTKLFEAWLTIEYPNPDML
jgi:hypothetical protein